jgi:mxaJ protein
VRKVNRSGALRAAAVLMALISCLTIAAALIRRAREQPLRLAAVPATATPGIRLARGFARDVQIAKDALANADESQAATALDAARRLAIVLDTTAPHPVPRTDWVDETRTAIARGDYDRARDLLAPADERTLAEWAAPEAAAGGADFSAYVGAPVIDATGAQVGEIAAVSGEGVDLAISPKTASAGFADQHTPLFDRIQLIARTPVRRTVRPQDLFAVPARGGEAALVAAPTLNPRALRVCSDPNNLPFSDKLERGFENAIARVLARELGAELEYAWWPARRGFLRQTLNARRCDIVMGLPSGHESALTTRPLYRSSYVFVYGPKAPHATAVEAPELRETRIGVPIVGDGANPPPVDALVRQGLVHNLHGYSVYGDHRDESPPSELVRAVSRGDVDLAVAWGPLGGYYANQVSPPLTLAPLTEAGSPFAFDISLAVRRDDAALVAELDAVIARNRQEIDAILDRYHMPRIE